MRIYEICATQALSRTSINLADRVINPYMGCAFGCSYCYSYSSKASKKTGLKCGTRVDVRKNLPEILSQEISENENISKILFGSTTEVYQPIEKKYRLMRKMLKIISKLKTGVKYKFHLHNFNGYCDIDYKADKQE